MNYRLYLIDGTGPENWQEYESDMSRGFCMKLKKQNGDRVEYLRGPTISGVQTWTIGEAILAFIKADRAKYPKMRILLGGHSRGGAAAIYAARKLKEEKITVHGMVLFDAVRRAVQKSASDYAIQIASESHGMPILVAMQMVRAAVEVGLDVFGVNAIDKIPSNVERALHLVRDEKFSYFIQDTAEWKQLAKDGPSSPYDTRYNLKVAEMTRMHNAMRDACRFNCLGPLGVPTGFSFGNTGLIAEPNCQLKVEKFMATHGAMGGAPLDPRDYIKHPTYSQQIETQEVMSMLAAQSRVNGFLKELGFGGDRGAVTLSYKPMSLPGGKSQLSIGAK
jgi:pimeloyl-ACP methyl ester carboxylesterase